MIEILRRNEYGFLTDRPAWISWLVKENIVPIFCAGNAVLHKVVATLTWEDGRTD